MLSNEEKEAIEELRKLPVTLLNCHLGGSVAINTVLNLIDNQQKEIEELKMKLEVEKIDNKYNKEEAYEEMIPRYKIKAKIEEIDEVLKGQLIEKTRVYFEAQKEVLQLLLEEK